MLSGETCHPCFQFLLCKLRITLILLNPYKLKLKSRRHKKAPKKHSHMLFPLSQIALRQHLTAVEVEMEASSDLRENV